MHGKNDQRRGKLGKKAIDKARRRQEKEGIPLEKRKEEMLTNFKICSEMTNEGIVLIREGKCSFANAAARTIFDMPLEELLEKKFVELFPEPERELLEKKLTTKNAEAFESTFYTRKGRMRILRVTIHPPIKDEQSELMPEQVAIVRDISEYKQLLKNLHDSEETYRSIVENSLEGMMIVNNNYQFTYVNEEFARILKTTREKLLGRDFRDFLSEESLELVSERYRRRQKGEQVPKRYELVIKRTDGEKRNALISSTVFHDAEGNIRTLAVILDITEWKRATEALAESEQKFRLIFENSLDAIFWAEPETGTIINCNKAAEALLEREREEIIGQKQSFLHPPEQREVYQTMFQRHLENNGMVEEEGEVITKTGKIIPVLITATVVKVGEKTIIQGIFKNITKRKQAEEKLKQLNEELEERVAERTKQLQALNKELEAFAYSVSHDLRAPLRSISGFSKIIMEEYCEQLDEKGRDFLQRIDKATKQMEKLINGLLELSRLTRAELQNTEVDLSAMMAAIVKELQQEEPERKVEVKVEENIKVYGDKRLLETMLRNLMENAWKFTKNKRSAKITFGKEEKEGKTIYYLRDNGVGFNMHYKDKLFQVFQRLHSVEEFPGIGIGLANVQRIVKKHGGEVWAESREGEGTTFYFTLKTKENTK